MMDQLVARRTRSEVVAMGDEDRRESPHENNSWELGDEAITEDAFFLLRPGKSTPNASPILFPNRVPPMGTPDSSFVPLVCLLWARLRSHQNFTSFPLIIPPPSNHVYLFFSFLFFNPHQSHGTTLHAPSLTHCLFLALSPLSHPSCGCLFKFPCVSSHDHLTHTSSMFNTLLLPTFWLSLLDKLLIIPGYKIIPVRCRIGFFCSMKVTHLEALCLCRDCSTVHATFTAAPPEIRASVGS